MTLAFVVPGLDEAASEKAIAILQNRLSQEQEAALVLKHAHWNVTGPNFIAVHEMLDPEVEAVLAQADETAERIATLGGTPDGRADAIVRNRTWKSFDAEGRVGTEEYLKALIECYKQLENVPSIDARPTNDWRFSCCEEKSRHSWKLGDPRRNALHCWSPEPVRLAKPISSGTLPNSITTISPSSISSRTLTSLHYSIGPAMPKTY